MLLQLPHTSGCLVCGRANPHGLRLDLLVDDADASVHVTFTPRIEHIGFEGVVHGGIIATVFDEAMVWAATWAGRRFCVCAELSVRYLRVARVDQPLTVIARISQNRSRLKIATAEAFDLGGAKVAEAVGKYTPVSADAHRNVLTTFSSDPATLTSAEHLSP